MKKKLWSTIACLALVVFAGVTLAACGTSATTDAIRIYTGKEYTLDETTYFANENADTLSITEDGNTYTVTGTASFMTTAEAAAFYNGTAAEGDAYIIIELDLAAGTTIEYPTLSGTSSYTNSGDDDVLWLCIALTGDASSKVDTRTITVTLADGTETSYTLITTDVVTTQATGSGENA